MYTASKNVYRERIEFAKIKASIPIPNLIEIQKNSYERFLQMRVLPGDREDAGLQSVFKSVFPISDLRENCSLEFVDYAIGNWECKCGRLVGLDKLGRPCAFCDPSKTGDLQNFWRPARASARISLLANSSTLPLVMPLAKRVIDSGIPANKLDM